MPQNFSELANFLWSVADLLRGDYKQSDYGKVILPFTLLRRLDCVLESTKADVLAEHAKRKESGVNLDPYLKRKSKQAFYNSSEFTLPSLLADTKALATLKKAGDVAHAKYDDADFKYGEELTRIARLKIRLGQYEDAEKDLNKALVILANSVYALS